MERISDGVALRVLDIPSKPPCSLDYLPQSQGLEPSGHIRHRPLKTVGSFPWLVDGPEVERKFGKRRMPNYLRLHISECADRVKTNARDMLLIRERGYDWDLNWHCDYHLAHEH
jgi:hypothetical protein